MTAVVLISHIIGTILPDDVKQFNIHSANLGGFRLLSLSVLRSADLKINLAVIVLNEETSNEFRNESEINEHYLIWRMFSKMTSLPWKIREQAV
jgi:hypothetical protein